jgi:hypothetical protein
MQKQNKEGAGKRNKKQETKTQKKTRQLNENEFPFMNYSSL